MCGQRLMFPSIISGAFLSSQAHHNGPREAPGCSCDELIRLPPTHGRHFGSGVKALQQFECILNSGRLQRTWHQTIGFDAGQIQVKAILKDLSTAYLQFSVPWPGRKTKKYIYQVALFAVQKYIKCRCQVTKYKYFWYLYFTE